ncbi:GNAT family N-acetyltransferase [Pararhodobacter aggregans]|uniref:GNAT family N-acetyltransferase n=1 Tax=Pararhodobacter aggregans TaxID=404875 RepID=A0A2T7UWD0_9RHOB|nr:GNAT family N-acetyltransferase [Pararhodobacter aggregans]PTX04761.1 L-amino acid N-acyltransferase YncA [Pararhodobacter aggregans]PVE49093.1 GNAT family N-acetyltransferase [Pararhodobacter aggregans]
MLIRRPQDQDRAAWEDLYAGYAAFYQVTQTAEMRARVWDWIHDPAQEVEAFVAEDDAGRLVGLTHFRPYARPLSASTGGFLDDLFVTPEARGSGAARALIEAVAAEGRARGWTLIRWITAEDNARARALYDKLATATQWKTYDLKL